MVFLNYGQNHAGTIFRFFLIYDVINALVINTNDSIV